MKTSIFTLLQTSTVLVISAISALAAPAASLTGLSQVGYPLTLTFEGPDTREDASTNPFLDYRFTVIFTHRDGTEYIVPGFYAADGNAADTSADAGNKWQVRFTPDRPGEWSYLVNMRAGAEVAVKPYQDDPAAGSGAAAPDGQTGAFTVTTPPRVAGDLRPRGMAFYVGKPFLRFPETGEYWIKGGTDSPENLLAYYEFDQTKNIPGRLNDDGLNGLGSDGKPGLHEFAAHAAHYDPADAGEFTWQSGKGVNILGAIRYLADQGMNNLYFLTYNIDGGDGLDTWPWTSENERLRFDVSKLDQWNRVFSYMSKKGMQLHVVTQETENDQALGGLTDGVPTVERRLYYRELVARFAHHLLLQWNLGEENKNSDAERTAFAQYIRKLDPYDHPIAFHINDNAIKRWDPHYGQDYLESASLQTNPEDKVHNQTVLVRERSTAAGRPWTVYEDEQNRTGFELDLGNLEELIQHALWGNLIGGGAGVEWYFFYFPNDDFGDIELEDFSHNGTTSLGPIWQRTHLAMEFMHEHLPFWEMANHNGLVGNETNNSGQTMCLAWPGQIYALYIPDSGDSRDLDLTGETGKSFAVKWFDPVNGGAPRDGSVTSVSGGGGVSLGDPPDNTFPAIAVVEVEGGYDTSPEVMTDALDGASLNQPYEMPLVAFGGQGTLTWDHSGTLPTGITRTGDTLSGTPTESGPFPIIVTVTDADGDSASRSLTLIVSNPSTGMTVIAGTRAEARR